MKAFNNIFLWFVCLSDTSPCVRSLLISPAIVTPPLFLWINLNFLSIHNRENYYPCCVFSNTLRQVLNILVLHLMADWKQPQTIFNQYNVTDTIRQIIDWLTLIRAESYKNGRFLSLGFRECIFHSAANEREDFKNMIIQISRYVSGKLFTVRELQFVQIPF